jgi:two-component system response regulator FlrC
MPEAMLEALLFGHTKGAFTGATQAHEGFFRAADGGTLLLDEIAEMPLSLQAKLLRALQEGEVVPIGSTQPVRIDVRIIAAANRDLPTEVAEGRFRADLFYRLNVFPLALRPCATGWMTLPPRLRADAAPQPEAPPIAWISDGALAMLRMHGWPGNVRELENVIRRALLLADTGREARRNPPRTHPFRQPRAAGQCTRHAGTRGGGRWPPWAPSGQHRADFRGQGDHGNAGRLQRQPGGRRARSGHFGTHLALSPGVLP